MEAVKADTALAQGLNTYGGHVTYEAVAKDLGYAYVPIVDALGAKADSQPRTGLASSGRPDRLAARYLPMASLPGIDVRRWFDSGSSCRRLRGGGASLPDLFRCIH